MEHAYNPSTREVDTQEEQARGYPLAQKEHSQGWDTGDLASKKIRKKKNE